MESLEHSTSGEVALASPTSLDDSRPGWWQRLAMRALATRLDRSLVGSLRIGLPDGRVTNHGSGAPSAELAVHRWRFFGRLLRDGDIGAGEAYVDGDWSSPDVVALTRLFLANESALGETSMLGGLRRAADRLLQLLRSNTRSQARRNISAHYDLSNDFYSLFLDPTMTYSAALFESSSQSLRDAQLNKYRALARKAGLQRGDAVLEIGCGWGGFAEYAAGEIGCRVTGVTISEEQARFARTRIERAGLTDLVTIEVRDYRDIEGSFDAIVSIEMIEAVGHRFLPDFFAACDRLLAPSGRLALQTITIPEQLYDRYRRNPDWIRRHVFPGGHLPSLGAIQEALARRTRFMLHDVENIAIHYAETLRRWRDLFRLRVDEVRELGFDDRFVRLWDFYLAICEAAFAQRKLATLQLVMTRPGQTVLPSGPYAGG